MIYFNNKQYLENFLLRKFLIVLFCFSLSSCGSEDESNEVTTQNTVEKEVVIEKTTNANVSEEIQLNKEKWIANNISNYTVEMQKICFCEPDAVRMMIFNINDNQISDVTYADTGDKVDPSLYNDKNTVLGMFTLVEESILRNPEQITISYDKKLGYIKQLTIDQNVFGL